MREELFLLFEFVVFFHVIVILSFFCSSTLFVVVFVALWDDEVFVFVLGVSSPF